MRGEVKFQRRHFQFIAERIAFVIPKDRPEQLEKVAEYWASELGATNPQFNRERFIEACKKAHNHE